MGKFDKCQFCFEIPHTRQLFLSIGERDAKAKGLNDCFEDDCICAILLALTITCMYMYMYTEFSSVVSNSPARLRGVTRFWVYL